MKFHQSKILFLIIIFLFTSELSAIENKILFKINNEIITTVDLHNESKYLELINPNLKNLKKEKIYEISKNSLIREKIKDIELRKNFGKLEINEKYFAQLINDYSIKMGFRSVDELQEYINSNNLSFDNIKKKINDEVLWNQLIVKKFLKDVKIDKEQIKLEIKKSSKQAEYFLSEIVFNVENKDDLNEKFKTIKNDINQKGFTSAATIHGISDTSNSGGKLGWIKQSSLSKKIQTQILNMQIGAFTKPIIIPGGFLILKIVDKRLTNKKLDIDSEIDSIVQEKTNEQLNRFSITYFNKIKRNIQINEI